MVPNLAAKPVELTVVHDPTPVPSDVWDFLAPQPHLATPPVRTHLDLFLILLARRPIPALETHLFRLFLVPHIFPHIHWDLELEPLYGLFHPGGNRVPLGLGIRGHGDRSMMQRVLEQL